MLQYSGNGILSRTSSKGPVVTDHSPAKDMETVEWEYRIPLLTNRFMLWDIARLTGVSVLIMYALVAIMGWFVDGYLALLPPAVLAIAAGILLGLFVIASALLGNQITATFAVGPEGVAYRSESRKRKASRLAIALGVLGRDPGLTGAGLLAYSRETSVWPWEEIHAARYYPQSRVIVLRNSWRTMLRLHCTAENYDAVRALVEAGIASGAGQREAPAKAASRGSRPWWSLALGVTIPLAGGALTAAWPWLHYDPGMRVLVIPVLLLIVAGVFRGGVGKIAAAVSLGPMAYIIFLTIREMIEPIPGVFLGVTTYSWQLDTGLLVLTLAGELLLAGFALWILFGGRQPERSRSS